MAGREAEMAPSRQLRLYVTVEEDACDGRAQAALEQLEAELHAALLRHTAERLAPSMRKKGRTGKKYSAPAYLMWSAGLQTISRWVVRAEGGARLDGSASYWTFRDKKGAHGTMGLATAILEAMGTSEVAVEYSEERLGVYEKAAGGGGGRQDTVNISNLTEDPAKRVDSEAGAGQEAEVVWEYSSAHVAHDLSRVLAVAAGRCPQAVVTSVAIVPGGSAAYATAADESGGAQLLEGLAGAEEGGGRGFPLHVRPAARRDVAKQHADGCKCISCTPACSQGYDGSVPGLKLQEEFLTRDEEAELLAAIDAEGWQEPGSDRERMQRRVQHYGYAFNYHSRNVDPEQPLGGLPAWAEGLADRMMALGWLTSRPDQVTVNEYLPGQGIRCHVDTHSAFEAEITSLSLGSAVTFNLYDEEFRTTPVWLRPRTLLVMTGASRYAWRHAIGLRKQDPVQGLGLVQRTRRVSLTFRTVNKARICECAFPALCDSRGFVTALHDSEERRKEPGGKAEAGDMPELGVGLEEDHVVAFYETVAEHFSSTRHSPWPNVRAFLLEEQERRPWAVVGDLGCGNGKYLKCVTAPCVAVGSDISSQLARICGEEGHNVCVASSLRLPFRSQAFDVTLCIAVLHHISTPERRKQLAEEMVRVMRPGGVGLVYAWAFEQQAGATGSRKFATQDCFVPWHLPLKYLASTEELPCGGVVHAEKRTVELQRYCHLFSKGELEALFSQFPGISVTRSYYDQSNWCVVLAKRNEGG